MKTIVHKFTETKDHCFDTEVFNKEKIKEIAKDFHVHYDPKIEDIDLISARFKPTIGEDLTETKIDILSSNIFCDDHYVPIRIYQREDHSDKVILFIHGGGFITGKVTDKDEQCRYLAQESHAKIIAVEYRLAPETMFPGQLNDCLAGIDAINQTDPSKLILVGDSAGANLCVACCLKRPNRIDMAILLYGAFDLEEAEDTDYHWDYSLYETDPSQENVIRNRLLRFKKLAADMKRCYIPDQEDVRNELISPYYSKHLDLLPRTLMIEAEFDYYRICNENFAQKLYDAGVDLEEIFYEGVDHAFLDSLGRIPQAKDCLDKIAEAVKKI